MEREREAREWGPRRAPHEHERRRGGNQARRTWRHMLRHPELATLRVMKRERRFVGMHVMCCAAVPPIPSNTHACMFSDLSSVLFVSNALLAYRVSEIRS